MKVMKFGGSSVSNPERIRDVRQIVLEAARKEKTVVVVSAFQGVTNQLLECARLAEAGDKGFQTLYEAIASRHREALDVLLGSACESEAHSLVEQMLRELEEALHGMYLLRHSPRRALDLAGSFGERLSAVILSAYLNRSHPTCFVDARQLVVTDDQFTHAAVHFDRTNKKTREYFKRLRAASPKNVIAVVTGFIGSTEDGRTTTIGRNGSDYTAAIIGAALNVSMIEIWTDVDGILSADPHAVPSAFVLPRMSYEEAMELSYFGAKVLHSATIAPAVVRKIPLLIKNTMNPSAPGTLISRSVDRWEGVAKGIASVDEITLLTLRGVAMVGVPGTAERMFRALARHQVNVILISQASSEHTICFAVGTTDVAPAKKALHDEFRYEFQNQLASLDARTTQTIIAIVGEGMRGTPGVSGKVFQALGRHNISISAIAQGASERNISLVIESGAKVRALNVIHQAFFEKRKHLALVVVGVGNIGSALLRQLHQQQKFLLSRGFDVRVCGVSDSKRYLLDANGIDLTAWRSLLDGSATAANPAALAREIAGLQKTDVALVDCTSSSEVVKAYPAFVEANMHIITPNKKANVLPWKKYAEFNELLAKRQKYFLYEANVGAGLPIISTLQDLIASGDTILQIEGIFSGTLSYLFNSYTGEKPFSELVREAHGLGYTEPDPRDDLSGEDVARKLLILGRQLGWQIDLKDVKIESLVPRALSKGKFSNEFYANSSAADRRMKTRLDRARTGGNVLRYIGKLAGGAASAGIEELPAAHPLASTKGSDNVIVFTTERYHRTPLVVQGPGAGADVTAMGVFSDILKLLHYLPQ